jgi:hypothetical protein
VLARWIERSGRVGAEGVGSGRPHPRRAKREALAITRAAAHKGRRGRSLKRPYQRISGSFGVSKASWTGPLAWRTGLSKTSSVAWAHAQAELLVEEQAHVHALGQRVVDHFGV